MSTRRQTRAKGMRTMADIARNAKSEKDKKEELSPVKEAPRSGRATPRPGGAGGKRRKRQLEYLDLESAVVRYLLLPIAVPCCRGVDGCIGLSCAQFGLAFGALCSERDQCLG